MVDQFHYQSTVTKPRLEIRYEDNSESPREWDNLGYFITCDPHYESPDKNPQLERIVGQTSNVASSVEYHMEMIKKQMAAESAYKVIAIYPIAKYEHGGITYRRGYFNGYDWSNNGFYIITDRTQSIMGTPHDKFHKVIDQELKTYNQYVNGEIYSFTLYDNDGNVEDSCSGFYDIEDIKDYLPSEYQEKDLIEFIV